VKTVELIPAYVWDCDHCGRENFQRAISRVLRPDSPDDADVIRGVAGLEPDDPLPTDFKFQVHTRPDRVACRRCKTLFRATDLESEVAPEDGDAA
jgi:hypothetical protein